MLDWGPISRLRHHTEKHHMNVKTRKNIWRGFKTVLWYNINPTIVFSTAEHPNSSFACGSLARPNRLRNRNWKGLSLVEGVLMVGWGCTQTPLPTPNSTNSEDHPFLYMQPTLRAQRFPSRAQITLVGRGCWSVLVPAWHGCIGMFPWCEEGSGQSCQNGEVCCGFHLSCKLVQA